MQAVIPTNIDPELEKVGIFIRIKKRISTNINMKKVTILDDEEANKSRKSRLKQQRKEDRDEIAV